MKVTPQFKWLVELDANDSLTIEQLIGVARRAKTLLTDTGGLDAIINFLAQLTPTGEDG